MTDEPTDSGRAAKKPFGRVSGFDFNVSSEEFEKTVWGGEEGEQPEDAEAEEPRRPAPATAPTRPTGAAAGDTGLLRSAQGQGGRARRGEGCRRGAKASRRHSSSGQGG